MIERVYEFFHTVLIYVPVLIPTVGFWILEKDRESDVKGWAIVFWTLFPLLILINFYTGFFALPSVAFLVLLRMVLSVRKKKYRIYMSFLPIILGLLEVFLAVYMNGFEFFRDYYVSEIIGAFLVISVLAPWTSIPEIILVSSTILLFFSNDIFRISLPVFVMTSFAVAFRDFIKEIYDVETLEFVRRIRKALTFAGVVVLILVYAVLELRYFARVSEMLLHNFNPTLESYVSIVDDVSRGKDAKGLLRDELFRKIVTENKPPFVEYVAIVKKNGVAVLGARGIDYEAVITEKNKVVLKRNGFDIAIVYSDPFTSLRGKLISHFSITLSIVIGILAFMAWMSRRTWGMVLERKVEESTQGLEAANQELLAMNEELVSMNEEIEKMYSEVSRLSSKIVEFLDFVKHIDIRAEREGIISEIYGAIKRVLDVEAVGYEILGKDGVIRRMVGKETEHFIDLKLDECNLRIFFESEVSFDEDEERFLEILSSIGTVIIYAHENYVSLEKSKTFMSKILNLLDMVLVVERREEAERILLKHALDLFDDVVVVALAWVREMEENKAVPARFMKKGDERVHTWILRDRGIMRHVLIHGEEYLVRNVFEDRIFVMSDERSRSAVALPLKTKEGVVGVFEIDRSHIDAFTDEDLRILRIFVRIVAMTLQRIEYYEELRATFMDTVEALGYAIELKDPYTRGHSRRVANYAVAIAERMGLPKETVETIEIAALLHDIGKIGVRGAVLNKPTKLTRAEFEEIMKHPILGEELVKRIRNMRHIAKIVRHHHENYGGGGYPDGLKGEEIPLESRIIAVADSFDAMTSDRPYRKAMPVEKALEILEKNERLQWDPNVLKVALEVFREMFLYGKEISAG